jgi:SAM-dependent methyltransferase
VREGSDPLAGIESGTLAPAGVRAMFDRIAPVYDVMNHVMTAGLDRRWRRVAAEAVVRPGDRVLDACCGTGDLAVACVRAGAGSVVGLDFSPRMIERARKKSDAVAWVEGDALSLPFEDGSFDAATVVLATVGIPTILMMLLFAVPFIDRSTERRLSRRPVAIVAAILTAVAMGVLTWKGATTREFLASEAPTLAAEFAEQNNLPDAAIPGAELFAASGCLSCHTYLSYGSTNLGAPDLTDEGLKNRGIQWQIDHLINPSSKSPGSPMPSYAAMGEENLRALAIFLEASKGPQE